MGKRILFALLVLMAGVVSASEALAQGASPQGVFSGTITKIDPGKKGIIVQGKDGELLFQWSQETRINGSPVGKEALILEKLKKGMVVTIFYREGVRKRVASRINVKKSDIETLKGWELPFVCGLSLC